MQQSIVNWVIQQYYLQNNNNCEATKKPTKVLIDTRILTPHVFEQVMMAYLSEKTKHPDKQAVIITNNGVTSGHKTMQTFQHCYTVGLRTKR